MIRPKAITLYQNIETEGFLLKETFTTPDIIVCPSKKVTSRNGLKIWPGPKIVTISLKSDSLPDHRLTRLKSAIPNRSSLPPSNRKAKF